MRSVKERTANLETCIKVGVEAGTKGLRCACPGIIQEWNATAQTVSVKLAIKEVLLIDGVKSEVEIPMLVDVPVVFPRAGGYSLVMVPQNGDECLVIFSDMCIDAWWQSGGIQSQAEFRRHDLSDGFAILGCWSQVRKPVYPTKGLRLQSDDGLSYIAIDESGVHFQNANFEIDDIYTNPNGVAIGMEPTATAQDKKFEVAEDHTASFYGETVFAGGFTAASQALFTDEAVFNEAVEFQGAITPNVVWQDISDTLSGVEIKSPYTEPVKVTKVCGIVHVQGVVFPTATIGANAIKTAIATLPEGYRPEDRVVVTTITGLNEAALIINTDGTVDLNNIHSSGISSSYFISLACSFVAG